jgi:hypothetical protein
MASLDTATDLYSRLKTLFGRIAEEHSLARDTMEVTCSRLTAREAIGDPQHTDYPIVRGREYMVAARFKGAVGQAYTDTFHGDFEGTIADVLALPLSDNHERAVFFASLNAVMRSLGLIEGTQHCKDEEPVACAKLLVDYLQEKHPSVHNVLIVGFQPRMVEVLSRKYSLRVTDLDADNIGVERFGVRVDGSEAASGSLEWCDIALVTGTTLVNATITDYRTDKPVIFYGVTVAGAAELLGLERFCSCERSVAKG